MNTRKTARAVCPHNCPDTCSMLVTLEEDRAVRVQGDPQHEFTQGFLCHKVSRYLERVYHPDRLTTPLKRIGPKGSGEFTPVSWDEALDTIAERMAGIAAGPDGPQAILPYSFSGTMGKIQSESLDRRFFHRLGASLLERTICSTAGVTGYRYTLGTTQVAARFPLQMLSPPSPHFLNTTFSNVESLRKAEGAAALHASAGCRAAKHPQR